MTVSDVVNSPDQRSKRTTVLYASYLLAVLVATFGWVGLLGWLAMAMIGD
jgi:hypothetical protein